MANPKDRREPWPKTVAEAVAQVIADLSEDDKALMRGMTRDDLAELHFSLGTRVRNGFGLHQGNDDLLRDVCGDGWFIDPDDASTRIIEAVWDALRAEARPSQDEGRCRQ